MWREVRDWFEELACRAGFDGLPRGARGASVVLFCVLAGVAGYFALGGRSGDVAVEGLQPLQPAVSAESTASSSAPTLPATLTVHVVGEVRHPGVYVLACGARAIDAIEAAGGMLGDANQAAVNLARPVTDGEQIAVPREGEVVAAAPGASAGTAGAANGGKVDLNSATAEQLDALPGIGPATAQKIVSDRTANGPFRNVDDLMRVPGIGPAKLEGLKDLVTTG